MSSVFKSLFTEEYAVFRRLLRPARKAAGLNQTELARRLDQTQLFVSRNELGDRKVDVIELRAVCRAIGIPFVAFVQQLDDELTQMEKQA